MASICVERPGALTTVQDAGRPGLAHLGVPRSGALDPDAHRRANRLVGNPETAPVLETTLTGVGLRFFGQAVIAVTGAVAPVRLDGREVGWGVPVPVGSGQLLDVGRARPGVRSYLAVSGGIAVPPALGSSSTDLLSGLGPGPLVPDQILAVGEPSGRPTAAHPPPPPPASGRVELPIRLGPRDGWLTPAGRATLTGAAFTVAIASNRIGVRLQGSRVEQSSRGELPSEGLVWGAVQLLPDGNLVVFLADHPTTGGYPVIAVVDPAGFSACAQAAPGAIVRFRLAAAENI
ncbi:MAG TPA: biotin-dependent carboxyltransferase family protein [Streptosporangiaceae bacterium]|nr:biotin-dependent carboxyltransferase family protein [Streptosporangiaceae bacterium]